MITKIDILKSRSKDHLIADIILLEAELKFANEQIRLLKLESKDEQPSSDKPLSVVVIFFWSILGMFLGYLLIRLANGT